MWENSRFARHRLAKLIFSHHGKFVNGSLRPLSFFLSPRGDFGMIRAMNVTVDRCAGCPGGECLTEKFRQAIEYGEIDVSALTGRTADPGEFHHLFIKWVKSREIRVSCPDVACGIGDGATIVYES